MSGSVGGPTLVGRWARFSANVGGAIYGTITAAAVIAASAGHEDAIGVTLVSTVVTLVVFWLAHVYGEVVSHHMQGVRPGLPILRKAMVAELPLLEAPLLSVLFLVAGLINLIGDRAAVNLALWAAVAQLANWGVISARRQDWSWPAALLGGVVSGMFGVIIVVLKALLH